MTWGPELTTICFSSWVARACAHTHTHTHTHTKRQKAVKGPGFGGFFLVFLGVTHELKLA